MFEKLFLPSLTRNKRLFPAIFVALALTVGADTANNGVFRFLTLSLPDGTTNAQYAARFITANADGPVTFTNLTALPAGLSLDPLSGFLTGIPAATFNGNITVGANDTVQQIQFNVALKINAAGGGGNGGASFANTNFAVGRVGTVYAEQLAIAGGVGPFTFGAEDLPPGISLNGLTGVLSGTPTAAGRYYVTISAYDAGEANNSATVLPILILPSGSDFQFITQSLNNGEVGTPFNDVYRVTNAAGNVSFAASGLPPGLALDSTNGVVSGTPTNAGTFEVNINATDADTNTITSNIRMLVAPSSASHFYWNVFSLPPGLLGVSYERQPPITVAAANGGSVSYSATGLPPGITYNTASGELSGTPTEVGEYDTVFTATSNAEVLTLAFHFIILPITGGDIGHVSVNFWLTKQQIRLGLDGAEGWSGLLLFNQDRRTGTPFNPTDNELSLSLGDRALNFPAGSLAGTTSSMKFVTPSGTIPSESVRLSLSKQTLQWKTGKDTLTAIVPGLNDVALRMGLHSYRTPVLFNAKGGANGTSATRPCFVLASGKLKTGTAGLDTEALNMRLADESFFYQTNDKLRIRILQGATVLVDRNFTALGQVRQFTNSLGKVLFNLKTLRDTATTNRVRSFSYRSSTGVLLLSLSGLTLGGISNSQAHLTYELTVGERIYTTGVTFFGANPGAYSTSIPLR
jgi:hypothetical protein